MTTTWTKNELATAQALRTEARLLAAEYGQQTHTESILEMDPADAVLWLALARRELRRQGNRSITLTKWESQVLGWHKAGHTVTQIADATKEKPQYVQSALNRAQIKAEREERMSHG